MNEELFKRIGLLIKNARDRKNLSQQEVAEYVKVTKSAVSRWENGEVGNMGRSKIQSLAELLEISPLSIITGELEVIIPKQSINIPVYGSIPAGVALEAIEDIQGHEDIPVEWLKGNKKYIALKVKGDSMYPKYLEGDTVILLLQKDCESGQDCACYVNGYDTTLKTVYKTDSHVELRPINPNYPPQTYKESEVNILGIVKELRRKI